MLPDVSTMMILSVTPRYGRFSGKSISSKALVTDVISLALKRNSMLESPGYIKVHANEYHLFLSLLVGQNTLSLTMSQLKSYPLCVETSSYWTDSFPLTLISSISLVRFLHSPSTLYCVFSLFSSSSHTSVESAIPIVIDHEKCLFRPLTIPGTPGTYAPKMNWSSPHYSSPMVSILGQLAPMWKSFASIGFPLSVYSPITAQLLLAAW